MIAAEKTEGRKARGRGQRSEEVGAVSTFLSPLSRQAEAAERACLGRGGFPAGGRQRGRLWREARGGYVVTSRRRGVSLQEGETRAALALTLSPPRKHFCLTPLSPSFLYFPQK